LPCFFYSKHWPSVSDCFGKEYFHRTFDQTFSFDTDTYCVLTFVAIQEAKSSRHRVKTFCHISSGSFCVTEKDAQTISARASWRNFDSRRSRMRCVRGWCWSAARFVSWGSPAAGNGRPNYSCSTKGAANAVGSFRPN